MRLLLLSFVFALVAGAQTIVFVPQDFTRIPGLREFRVSVTAPEGSPIAPIPGMKIILEGTHQNIRVYFPTNLQAYVNDLNKRSKLRYVGIGMEIGTWALTSTEAMGAVKIHEVWIKTTIASTAAALSVARSLYDREYKPISIPIDFMPMKVPVSPGETVDFALWAQ